MNIGQKSAKGQNTKEGWLDIDFSTGMHMPSRRLGTVGTESHFSCILVN